MYGIIKYLINSKVWCGGRHLELQPRCVEVPTAGGGGSAAGVRGLRANRVDDKSPEGNQPYFLS